MRYLKPRINRTEPIRALIATLPSLLSPWQSLPSSSPASSSAASVSSRRLQRPPSLLVRMSKAIALSAEMFATVGETVVEGGSALSGEMAAAGRESRQGGGDYTQYGL